jgi:F-type H+-transporting ATPase subunit delta
MQVVTCPRETVAGDDPTISGMAGRYATALFELAIDANAIDAVKADLEGFDALVANNADLARLVRSPVFTAEEQTKALSAIIDRSGMSGLAAKFLKFVASNRRLFAVRDMIVAYHRLVARHKGELTAEVTVAAPLGAANLRAVNEALNAVTGKTVAVEVLVDPTIIGGLVVKLGSRMVDSSLRAKLNAIKHAMKEVA